MKKTQPNSIRITIWGVSALVTLMFLAGAVGAIRLLLSDDGDKRQRQIKMVTLVKPPPPPKIKEKPPEPEIKKKEEIIEPEQEPEPDPADDMSEDEGPLDDDLGLDADGSAGADGFGLKAKKGGSDLIGTRFGGNNLLRKYAWYTAIIQEDLRKRVNKHMEENGGVPKGNLTAQIKITLNENGQITGLALDRPTGNQTMDRALKEALLLTQVSEPPPAGMPRMMRLKINSKG